jgi:hypothetical protein
MSATAFDYYDPYDHLHATWREPHECARWFMTNDGKSYSVTLGIAATRRIAAAGIPVKIDGPLVCRCGCDYATFWRAMAEASPDDVK